MKKLTVEFIENNIAKCEKENKQFEEIDVSLLPKGVKSGDVVIFDGESYKIIAEETDLKKNKLLEMQANIFGKKKL